MILAPCQTQSLAMITVAWFSIHDCPALVSSLKGDSKHLPKDYTVPLMVSGAAQRKNASICMCRVLSVCQTSAVIMLDKLGVISQHEVLRQCSLYIPLKGASIMLLCVPSIHSSDLMAKTSIHAQKQPLGTHATLRAIHVYLVQYVVDQ